MDRSPRVFEDKTRWKLELAVVQEAWKIRVVHDGSNGVHVNHRIRPRDQVRSPGAGELRAILRSKAALGKKLFVVSGDVSKAHRRIKIRQEDWGSRHAASAPDVSGSIVWAHTA